ncbi:MAG: iron-sulfur cluster assembly accessory protein [Bacteroidota bacterium]
MSDTLMPAPADAAALDGAAIQITDKAAAKLRAIADQEGVDTEAAYLRVAVIPGGCSGLTYDLGWDTTRRDEDELLEAYGLRIIFDLKSFLYFEGSTLDFSDGLDGRGFHFENPQAMRTCACGESFSL